MEVYLVNILCFVDNLKDIVVMFIYIGRIYYVVDLLGNIFVESFFEGSLKYFSFVDYFYKKYGIVLNYLGQLLLLLKQIYNLFNFFIDSEVGVFRRKMMFNGNNIIFEIVKNYVYMFFEFLVSINVLLLVLRVFYLIFLLMYRMEILMLVSQLREEIGLSNFNNILSLLILEVFIIIRCCEDFFLERLEFFGDLVLKYVVSCYVFFKYFQKYEGQLFGNR